ncbi:MAG: AMP-binding protein [Rhodospirillaceae bacterium]|nr:AMP-binding protein [Rhodospirillaceae bacterium]
MLKNLAQVASTAAERFGSKPALVFEGRWFSFAEIDALACRLANALKSLGIRPGDRVTLYSGNCWEWIVSYYGILKTGAVVNPLNVMLTPAEVAYVARDCGARAIVAAADKGEALLDLRKDTPIEHTILFGSDAPAGARAFEDVIHKGKDTFKPPAIDTDALSTICYTSGTTGHPKGAMLSHRNVLTNTALTAVMHRRVEDDIIVTALPCAHVYGNVVMNGCFLYGATLALLRRFEEIAVLEAVQEHRATMFEGVPTAYMMLLAHPDFAKYDLTSLQRCTVGGQAMPIAKGQEVEKRFGCPLLDLWGMTEIAGLGTTHAWYAENRLGSIGVALPYVQVRIADAENAAKTLAPDEVGELMVKGPIVMQGYFGNEQATREAIEPDGWLHTGDLAKMDAQGFVYIVDRKKDIINTAGYKVFPAEIERVLAAHPAIAMSAVGRVPDKLKGELAKAYVVLKPGAAVSEADILGFCRNELAAYKVPRAVKFVPSLPMTSTGKLMRRELAKLDG